MPMNDDGNFHKMKFFFLFASPHFVKLKIQLDLGLGQPKRFLSAKAQDDWQVKNST
jgi:hypothetical protein